MRFEGVILTPPVGDHSRILDLLDALRIRYVRIAPTKELGRSDSVSPDNAQGMQVLVAAGLINYAWAHGVNVPQALSVVGYDDDEVAQALWPALTAATR